MTVGWSTFMTPDAIALQRAARAGEDLSRDWVAELGNDAEYRTLELALVGGFRRVAETIGRQSLHVRTPTSDELGGGWDAMRRLTAEWNAAQDALTPAVREAHPNAARMLERWNTNMEPVFATAPHGTSGGGSGWILLAAIAAVAVAMKPR